MVQEQVVQAHQAQQVMGLQQVEQVVLISQTTSGVNTTTRNLIMLMAVKVILGFLVTTARVVVQVHLELLGQTVVVQQEVLEQPRERPLELEDQVELEVLEVDWF